MKNSNGTGKFPKFEHQEFDVFKKLNSPQKVQDFLDKIPVNFGKKGHTLRSPLFALNHNQIHCMEGALLASAIFWYHGNKPLLLDLKTTESDFDHVVALFKRNGLWGAVSKTNHAVLRYRDPVYKSVRELAMSYFNEYFTDDGVKTMRSYSLPFDLRKFSVEWLTSSDDLWDIGTALDESPHKKIFPNNAHRHLRPAHTLEIKAGKLTEWKK